MFVETCLNIHSLQVKILFYHLHLQRRSTKVGMTHFYVFPSLFLFLVSGTTTIL